MCEAHMGKCSISVSSTEQQEEGQLTLLHSTGAHSELYNKSPMKGHESEKSYSELLDIHDIWNGGGRIPMICSTLKWKISYKTLRL